MAKYIINGKTFDVEITDVQGNLAQIKVNGKNYEVKTEEKLHAMPTQAAPASQPILSHVLPKPTATVAPVVVAPVVAPAAPAAAAASSSASGAKVTAPLPGTITDIKCTVGQAVKAGDIVVVLEAMKMQNNIEAENAGTVKEILVSKGDSVMEGATLVVIG